MSPLKDRSLWAFTQVADYAFASSIALLSYVLFYESGEDTQFQLSNTRLSTYCAFQGACAVLVLWLREEIYFYVIGERVPKAKQKPLPDKTYPYIFQTYSLSMFSFFLMYRSEIIFWSPASFTLEFWSSIFAPFYLLLVLRDVFFLAPLHRLMHTKKYYHLHKLHHEATSDAQSLHAFQIDVIDLMIENVGAPFLLFGLQWALDRRVGIHWLVGVLLTFHDGGLHSINPFSVMYFNPFLEWLLEPNVTHQLHHALNKGYYLFVPWGHLISRKERLTDCQKYNKVLKCDFSF
ncbi:hypothetical protein TrVE_jg10925 [Triparma verrucosa]|uniref:Fatty acid hydroxylase domain-containing protein n=1 Tax=Triparma verrucosa TaxID=1606542 RepID=A0A9W7KW35_9STRA|nr:hypothetical protein TrVE_jg10925 [Triparma verrucosa]